jgi:nucleoid-associated protein
MNLNLKKIVIHELAKQALITGAELNFSNKCLIKDEEKPQKLNAKLVESFGISRNKIDYAVFQEGEAFPQSLMQYLDSEQTDDDFLEFSKEVLIKLRDQITNIVAAKGGYLVFSEYISQQSEFVSIFLVRDTQGEIFTRRKEFLDIGEITYADTNKLAMACRINVNRFLKNDGKPLSIINKRNKEVSEYFAKWLGASDKESSELYTEELYRVISKIEPPINPDAPGKRLTVDETRKKVFELVKTDLKGEINLNVLSKVVYGDEDKISNFIELSGIEMPTEFRTYPKTMKKFVQIRVNNDGFLLQFSRGDSSKIRFSEDDESVIIRSKKLFDDLQRQISDLEN